MNDSFRDNRYKLDHRSICKAAHETGRYHLTAVYSRKLATAQSFAEKYGEVTCVDDLTAFFQLEELDTVYIASPNSLHFEQAKQGILSGKM